MQKFNFWKILSFMISKKSEVFASFVLIRKFETIKMVFSLV